MSEAALAQGAKPAGAACETCPRRDRPYVLPEIPSGSVRLSLVGEAPNRTDTEKQRCFASQGGRQVARFLSNEGVSFSSVHRTYAVLCEGKESDLAEARKCCAERLRNEIAAVDAPAVLTLGAVALQSALGASRKPSIMKYRGSVIENSSPLRAAPGAPICPTIHPAFVRGSPLWEPVLRTDVERAVHISRGYALPENSADIHTVFDLELLEQLCNRLGETVAFDVETTGLEATTVGLICYALSDGELTIVVPYGQYDLEHRVASSGIVSRALSTRTTLTHNGPSYDHVVAARYGIEFRAWEDSLLGYHALASHFPKRLGHVVATYLDAPPWKEEKHGESDEQLWRYNARDVIYTARAWRGVAADLRAEGQYDLYQIDKANAALCTQMQLDGFAFDRERAAQMDNALSTEIAELEERAASIAGRPLKLLSPKDLGAAMFEELGAPVYFRSDKGTPSLGVEAMRAYALSSNERVAALATAVLRYRRLRKTLATYIRSIHIHPDGRVRPYWMNYGALTGRWSCQAPNLMNLARPENDPTAPLGGIRSLYIAPPGKLLFAFDMCRFEMYVAAYWSGDEAMIAACEGGDIHAANAEVLFGAAFTECARPELKKALRSCAKTSGLAVNYLAGASTVYQQLMASGTVASLAASGWPITLRHCEVMLERLHSRYGAYYAAQDELYATAVRTGYVESPISGRRRHVGHAPVQAEIANYPIQAGAADVMNARLPALAAEARSSLGAILVSQNHDAATFEVAEEKIEKMRTLAIDMMGQPFHFGNRTVSFPCDTHVGKRWSEV